MYVRNINRTEIRGKIVTGSNPWLPKLNAGSLRVSPVQSLRLALGGYVLNVNGVNAVRETEVHTGKPLASKPSAFEVKTLIEMLGCYKSAGNDQTAAEFIGAEDRAVHSEAQTY